MLLWVDATGGKFLRSLSAYLRVVESFYIACRSVFFDLNRGREIYGAEILRQIYFTGVEAIMPVSLLALGMGLFAGFYTNSEAIYLGEERLLSRVITQLLVQSVGPLTVCLLVVARSGTAIASELGNMKVNREIEALRVLCVHPYGLLIFPRVVGGTIAVFGLGVIFSFLLPVASAAATFFASGRSPWSYISLLTQSWDLSFVVLLLGKYVSSAVLILLLSCEQGLSVQRSSFEVPRMASRAVLQSILALLVTHTLFSLIQNFDWLWEHFL